jgi:hypothetical protein
MTFYKVIKQEKDQQPRAISSKLSLPVVNGSKSIAIGEPILVTTESLAVIIQSTPIGSSDSIK